MSKFAEDGLPLSQLYRYKDIIYDSHTGEFWWASDQKKPHNKKPPGKLCGYKDSNGYLQINTDGKVHQAHRLAWFLVTGKWPEKQIDHIDRNIVNNSFKNLREAVNRQNALNRSNNTQTPGVRKVRKRFEARIRVDKMHRRKSFKTQEEAIQQYVDWCRELKEERLD